MRASIYSTVSNDFEAGTEYPGQAARPHWPHMAKKPFFTVHIIIILPTSRQKQNRLQSVNVIDQ